jgi:cell division protein ZapA
MSAETSVNIFGQSYVVKGEDPRHVRAVAAYVDQKMQELLADKPGGLSVRGAVLTALNLADELFRTREKIEQLKQEVENRSQALLQQLE